MKNFYNSTTLNLFTDASVLSYCGKYFCCGGAVAIVGSNIYNILDESFRVHQATNNYGELDSILQAVLLAVKIKQNNPQLTDINIFSDSAISIFGIRDWIYGWAKRARRNGMYYNSEGQLVANQELFMKIINIIIQNNLYIRFYHMRGHIEKVGFPKAIKAFKMSNGIDLSLDTFRVLSHMNTYVDNKSREILTAINLDDFIIYDKLYSYTYPTDKQSMRIFRDHTHF